MVRLSHRSAVNHREVQTDNYREVDAHIDNPHMPIRELRSVVAEVNQRVAINPQGKRRPRRHLRAALALM
jgi:hypothetical protein